MVYKQAVSVGQSARDLEISKLIFEVCGFISNIVTIIVGGIAIFQLSSHRGLLAQFVESLRLAHVSESSRRIRDTLMKLESLNFNEKEDKSEIRALFGQLSGQLKAFIDQSENIRNAHDEVANSISTGQKLTEPRKRFLVQLVHGAIDGSFQTGLQKIQEIK